MSQGNFLTITLPFSFKGESFQPACRVDLDALMMKGSIPCLYTHLANENRIDPYSHEYDVMMMAEMEFSDATGMAVEFLTDGNFDSEGFERCWQQAKLDKELQKIVSRHMQETALDQQPDLKKALTAAYQLGREMAEVEKKIHSTATPDF